MSTKIAKIKPRPVKLRELIELRNYLLNNPKGYPVRADLIKFVIDSAMKELKTNQLN